MAWIRGVWRWRFTDSVAALASACAGYTVWVAFNFDWAPATGIFWLLAGAAWSGVRMAEAQPVVAADRPPLWVAPARSAAAAGLALAFIVFAVLPILADAWYYQARADLSVRVDPLQSRYHWALGQELIADGNTKDAAAELRRAADLGETEPQLYVDLGDADAELGDRAQATRDYQRALLIDPYYAPAKQRLASLSR